MTPQPPPTQEQFELLERIDAEQRLGDLERDAMRAVLAYARLGVETYRLFDEAGVIVDRRDGIKSVRKDASVTLALELLETIEALGLLAPAAQEEKRDG